MSKNFFLPLLFLFFTSAGCDVNNEGKVISSDGLTLKNLWRQSKVEKKNALVITYGVRKRPPLQPDGVFIFGDAFGDNYYERPMMLDRATGRIKWKADDEAIGAGSNSVHQHGDIVLLHQTDRLIALDLKTGKTKWKKKRERRDSGNDNWGSLNVHGLGGIYFTAHDEKIIMGRVSDGMERVVTTLKKQNPETTYGPGSVSGPIPFIAASGDTLLVMPHDEHNENTKKSTYYVALYNLTRKKEEGTYEVGSSEKISGTALGDGAMHEGHYISTYERHIFSINPFTGKIRWKITPGTLLSFYDQPFTIVDDLLVIQNGDVQGYVYGIDVNTGELRWKTPRIGGVSSPFVMDGVVYVTGKGKGILTAMDLKTGKILLELSCPEKKDGVVFSTTPVQGENGIIYFDSERSSYAYKVQRQ